MKKRRSEGAAMEDADRNLHASFCASANSLSHLYTQAQNQQKTAFQAGQRHALEKLHDWIQKHHQLHGTVPSSAETLNYLKMEMESMNQSGMTISQVQSPVNALEQSPVLHSEEPSPCQDIFSKFSGDNQRLPAGFQTSFFQADTNPTLWTGK